MRITILTLLCASAFGAFTQNMFGFKIEAYVSGFDAFPFENNSDFIKKNKIKGIHNSMDRRLDGELYANIKGDAWFYNDEGQLVYKVYISRGDTIHRTWYEYKDGLLIKETFNNNVGFNKEEKMYKYYRYNDQGQVVKELTDRYGDWDSSIYVYKDGFLVEDDFNGKNNSRNLYYHWTDGRLDSLTGSYKKNPDQLFVRRVMTYNSKGLIESMYSETGYKDNYLFSFDAKNRLTRIDFRDEETLVHRYLYAYDELGRLASITQESDLEGFTAPWEKHHFTYTLK